MSSPGRGFQRNRPLGRRQGKGAPGFVLVLTIWILAALAIAAAYFGERVQAALRAAVARQDLASAERALSDARAEVLYRLATERFTVHGVGLPPDAIRLDGRPYSESGGTVELQDVGGLMGLNAFTDEGMARLLQTLGVDGQHHAALIDSLRDYTDADDLRRLQGAESAQYAAINQQPGARNAPLSSALELPSVFGWRAQPSLWRTSGGILDFVTPDNGARINPNTAPATVLTSLPGVTADVAAVFIARRELQAIDAAWVDSILGTRYDGPVSPIRTFPLDSIRVTHRVKGLPWALRYNVQLTPNDAQGPWKVTAAYRLELPAFSGAPSSAPVPPAATSADLPSTSPAHAAEPPPFPPRSAAAASAAFALPR